MRVTDYRDLQGSDLPPRLDQPPIGHGAEGETGPAQVSLDVGRLGSGDRHSQE